MKYDFSYYTLKAEVALQESDVINALNLNPDTATDDEIEDALTKVDWDKLDEALQHVVYNYLAASRFPPRED